MKEDEFDDDKEVYEIVGTNEKGCECGEKCDCEDEECECNPAGFEEVEIDVLEFGLNDSDIEELITKLLELRENKQQVEFDLDDENKFIINYENDDEFEDEEEMEGEDGD